MYSPPPNTTVLRFEAVTPPNWVVVGFRLQEMRLDRNALRELPPGLVRLRDLHTLSATQNRLSSLPSGLLGHMPALRALVSTPPLRTCPDLRVVIDNHPGGNFVPWFVWTEK